MVEVTKDNFEEVLPLIQESIYNSDYVAIDCEFSGKTPPHYFIITILLPS